MAGRGFSYTERNGTVVAMVAEVEVDRAQRPRVGEEVLRSRTTAARSSTRARCRTSIEGNVVQAVSRTLFEEVRFNENRVLSATGRPIRSSSSPTRRNRSRSCSSTGRSMPPTGAGEPSTRTVPAAIANAIFDATGVRMRRVPITPERMKAALARA